MRAGARPGAGAPACAASKTEIAPPAEARLLVPLVESVIGSFYRTVPGGESRFVGLRLYAKVLSTAPVLAVVLSGLRG